MTDSTTQHRVHRASVAPTLRTTRRYQGEQRGEQEAISVDAVRDEGAEEAVLPAPAHCRADTEQMMTSRR